MIGHWKVDFPPRDADFASQVQIYAYNSVLYANSSEARNRAYGIAAVSIFVKVTRKDAQTRGNGQDGFLKESKMTKPNLDLKMLTDQLQYITYKGDSVPLKALSIYELLPATAALITYEGSLTTPGCEETATWIVLNRPLYMSPSQVIRTNMCVKINSSTIDKAIFGGSVAWYSLTEILCFNVSEISICFSVDIGSWVGKLLAPNVDTTLSSSFSRHYSWPRCGN